MKLWLAFYTLMYQCDDSLLGVFSSRELAQAAVESDSPRYHRPDEPRAWVGDRWVHPSCDDEWSEVIEIELDRRLQPRLPPCPPAGQG